MLLWNQFSFLSLKSIKQSGIVIILPLAALVAGCSPGTSDSDNYNPYGSSPGSSPTSGSNGQLVVSHRPSDTNALGEFGDVPKGGKSSRVFVLKNTTSSDFYSLWISATYPFTVNNLASFGTSGACQGRLAAGASCEIVVDYSPGFGTTSTGTLEITYNDQDNKNKKLEIPLKAKSISDAKLELVGLTKANSWNISNYSYDNVSINQTKEMTFTLKNTGGRTATDLNITISDPTNYWGFAFKGGSYPGGGTCGKTLDAGASCTFIIAFTPKQSGLCTNSPKISYKSGTDLQNFYLNLSGTGLQGATLTLSPYTMIPLGATAIGHSSTSVVTVYNYSSTTATNFQGFGETSEFGFAGGKFPGTGGTCGTKPLSWWESCTVIVSFTPTTIGYKSYSGLKIQFNDGIGTSTVNIPEITGSGAQAPRLVGFSGDFGEVALGDSVEKTLTLENFSAESLSYLKANVYAPYSIVGGTCSINSHYGWVGLSSGSTCTIILSFKPTYAGSFQDGFDLQFTSSGYSFSSVKLPLRGIGKSMGSLSFGNAALSFGTIEAGKTKDQTVTISNVGSVGVTQIFGEIQTGSGLPSLDFQFKGSAFPGLGGTCNYALAAGSSCQIVLSFTPANASFVSNYLKLNYHNGIKSQTVSLSISGSGVFGPKLVTSGFSGDFGEVSMGESVEKTITITNTGELMALDLQPLPIGAPFEFKGGFPGIGGTCPVPTFGSPATLAGKASCTVVVTFKPSTVVAANQSFGLNYTKEHGGAISAVKLLLSGKGRNAANLTFASPEYDFGVVESGGSSEKTLTVTNTGTEIAKNLIHASGNGALFQTKNGTCGLHLYPGASCTIIVTFTPNAVSALSAIVHMGYSDGTTPKKATVTVKGEGKKAPDPANLYIGGASTNFGTVGIGQSSERTFIISNSGEKDATDILVATAAASFLPYSFKGGLYPGIGGTCTNTLPQKGNCTIVVVFTPDSQGASNRGISVTYRSGTSSKIEMVNLAVTGIGKPSANSLVVGGLLGTYGPVSVGKTATRSFTITNENSQAVSGIHFSGLSAPFELVAGNYAEKCGSTLNPGASCKLNISFAPDKEGEVKQDLKIQYSTGFGSGHQTAFSLSGTGITPSAAAKALSQLGDDFEAIDPMSIYELANLRTNQSTSKGSGNAPLIQSVIAKDHSKKFNYQDLFQTLGSSPGADEIWKTQLSVPRVIGYSFRGDARAPEIQYSNCPSEWKNGFTITSEVTGHAVTFPPMIDPDTKAGAKCGIKDVHGFWPTYTRPSDMVFVDKLLKAYKTETGKDFDMAKQNILELKPYEMKMASGPGTGKGMVPMYSVANTLNWYLHNVMSVHAHVYNNYDVKGFISTSRSASFAKSWVGTGYVYATLVEGGYEMPGSSVTVKGKSFTMAPQEQEIAVVGGVPWDDIMAYVEVSGGYFTGKIMVRKGFDKMDPAAYAKILRIFAGETY